MSPVRVTGPVGTRPVGTIKTMTPNPGHSRPPYLAAADPGVTPPGWYTVADGRELWWDGHRWIVTPQPGAQVQPQPQPTTMVTSVPVQTAHTAHLIATICTCGFWAPFWAASAVWNSMRRDKHVTRIQ